MARDLCTDCGHPLPNAVGSGIYCTHCGRPVGADVGHFGSTKSAPRAVSSRQIVTEWRIVTRNAKTDAEGTIHYHATRLNADKHARELGAYYRDKYPEATMELIVQSREVTEWRNA